MDVFGGVGGGGGFQTKTMVGQHLIVPGFCVEVAFSAALGMVHLLRVQNKRVFYRRNIGVL